MAKIREKWQAIRAEVRKSNRLTEAALISSRSMSIVNGTLVLAYPNDLLMSKMATEENLTRLRDAIRQVLGFEMDARCVVAGQKASSEENDAETSGIVRTALDLGGKIVYKE